MKKSNLKKYIFLLLGVILVGALLVIGLMKNDELNQSVSVPMVRTESMYVIFALAFLLLLAVVFLTIVVFKNNLKKNNAEMRLEVASNELEKPEEKKDKKKPDSGERFFMLTKTDREQALKKPVEFDRGVTLSSFCERFRNFSASKLGLYYDIEDIRKFVASLAVTKIVVMQGMSGTGKTSLAFALGEFLQNPSTIVPVQPMWKERTDLIGYYNEFTKKFNETTLLQKLYEANYSEEIFVTVLDEMNIARVEYYFAEFLSLLEIPTEEGRYLDVVSDVWKDDPKLLKGGKIKLPSNMWFIGTANNDDSTFAISDKVYDRAMVMNLDKKANAFFAEETSGIKLSYKTFIKLVDRAKKEFSISQRNLRRISKLDKYLVKTLKITFGNRIMKQLRDYIAVFIACGGRELEAIDDILCKKVLRKLEAKNPVLVKNNAEGLKDTLTELFGENEMLSCKEYLTHLEQNA